MIHKSEIILSKKIHSDAIPFLISPKLLRKYNCSQVDLAIISKTKINLYEVKSSNIGVLNCENTRAKKSRIVNTQILIHSIFKSHKVFFNYLIKN